MGSSQRYGAPVLQLLAVLTLLNSITTAELYPHLPYERPKTIERDVVVIGGGAAGTHAAVRLQQEGKSVALLERNDRLGGHVNTYVDPATGRTFDYGVITFLDVPVVTDYFKYLDVQWSDFGDIVLSEYADVSQGRAVSSAQASKITGNVTAAFETWIEHLERYPWLTNQTGYHIPSPFPEELFLPFGDYLVKYGMEGVAELLFYTNLAGNILAQPTFYMMKWQNLPGSTSTIITQADGDNQAIYDAALAKLGNATNVFLQSDVHQIERADDCVRVSFSTPSGRETVQASQLVMAIPPKVETLNFLDLSGDERSVLGHFNNSYVWNAVFLNTGAPHDMAINNFEPKAPLGIPAMPATAVLYPSANVPNAHEVEYGSAHYLPDEYVKDQMFESVAKLQRAYGFSSPNGTSVQLAEFHDHSPYLFTVSKDAARSGFYDKLNALQGRRRTWWTGSAFETEASSNIWNFTNYEVLPELLAALNDGR